MSSTAKRERSVIGPASKPALPRHVKTRHDKVRDVWTVMAPERVYTPDAIAVAVLQLCDGVRSVDTIADALAQTYDADKGQILADVIPMLQDLADKGVIDA